MATETNGKETPRKKSKLGLVLTIVLAAVLPAAASYYYFFNGPNAAAGGDPPEPPYQTVDMGDMTINLADPGDRRYLRVNIVIELPDDKELAAEFDTREHRIRHDLLHALRQKTAADVGDPNDLDDICRELLGKVNNHLTAGRAEGVFFREYLFQ